MDRPIVLFDGVCNLCDRSVRFIVRRDPGARLRFAPLQSEAGRRLLERHGLEPDRLDTMVLVEGGRAYSRSDAALRIARHLSPPWPMLAGALVFPRSLRDGLYDVVARRRYRWFGRKDACMVPKEAGPLKRSGLHARVRTGRRARGPTS